MLRPTSLSDIIGQSNVLTRLKIHIKSSQKRQDILPHILLGSRGPGLGKTTIALAISREFNKTPIVVNCANVTNPKQLLPYLVRLQYQDILIADEIHCLNRRCQDLLLTVLEDFKLNLVANKIDKEAIVIDLPKFTCIACSTQIGSLNLPLIDRFPIQEHLQLYSVDELTTLAQLHLSKLNINMPHNCIKHIAKIARGTPRILNTYLIWIRDYIVSQSVRLVDEKTVQFALKLKGVDKNGLTTNDKLYLSCLLKIKRPVGLKPLMEMTKIDRYTIENIIEPFLVNKGYVLKTSKGRMYNIK